ncbi:hypothetical protein DMENIID0001_052520 [Sergentomyia squamirostris]
MAKNLSLSTKTLSSRIAITHRHNLQGCVNLFSDATKVDLEDFKTFPWDSTYPTVKVLIPSIDTDSQEDTALKLIQAMKTYEQTTTKLKLHYKRVTNIKKFRKQEKRGMYSWSVVEMANHLQNHPDKYFSGEINWYFTGGILEVIQHKLIGTMIFCAMGPELTELGVYHEPTMSDTTDANCQILSLSDCTPILEISSVSTVIDYTLMIRQKNVITIIETEKKTFDLDDCKVIESAVPIVAAFLDNEDSNFAYTLDAEKFLRKWSLSEPDVVEISNKNMIHTKKFRKDNQKKTSNWGTVCHLNDKLLIYADRHHVKLVNKILLDTCHTITLEEYAYPCSEICFVKVSKFQNLIYIASTHDCFAVGWTQETSKIVHAVHLRWTHQLGSHPMFLETCLTQDDAELILVASMEPGDSKILCNERGVKQEGSSESEKAKYEYKSYYYPSKLRNLTELYNIARLRSKCINPTIPMRKRIDFSTCGISILRDMAGTVKILTANSVGDIFEQELTKSEADITPWIESIECLEQHIHSTKVIKKSDKEINPRFQNTGVVNLKSLQKVFRCRQFKRNNGEEEKIAPKRRAKWKRPIKELRMFKDILSQDILDIWELSDDETQNVIDNDSSYVQTLPAREKVGNWLEKMMQEDEQPIVEEVPTMTDVQNVSQDIITDSPMPEISAFRTTPTQKRQKRKIHNMGF